MTKEKSLEKFNPNKKFSVKGSKYHPFYIDLDGKRPPPKIIIWYLNISILIAISIWFIPESINYYSITHIFIDFMQTLVPKIAQFKELAGEGHVAKTMPFYVSLIWFWIFTTFLPLIYVQSKFMSKKVLLGDFEYYCNKICKKRITVKLIFMMPIFFVLFPLLTWWLPPDIGDIFFEKTYKNPIGITITHGSVMIVFYLVFTIMVGFKSRIILTIFKCKKEKT
jgi:hypothetical protein